MNRDYLFTYHKLTEKERKNLTILELIRERGPVSRTDISKDTDINMVSVSNYVKNYIAKGLVTERGYEISTGGRRPELVEFNDEGGYIIGLDIGTTTIYANLTDIGLNKIASRTMPRPSGGNEEILASILGAIREMSTERKIETKSIKGIGIGVFGEDLFDIAPELENKLGIKTYMGSDAACAAFGEKKLGDKTDVEDLLYIYSDVGCGIIIRGDIYFGAGGLAGETQVFNDEISKQEEQSFVKNLQYLRPWSVEMGMVETAKREIARGVGTSIVSFVKGDISNLAKEDVIEAAKSKDEIALEIVREAGINLGIRVAYLVNLFDPEIVVIGGGIEKAGELILVPIRDAIKKFSFSAQAQRVKIVSSFLGEDAVSMGAAALAIRELFIRV